MNHPAELRRILSERIPAPISDVAMRIGEEKLVRDLTEAADFLAGSEDIRERSFYFGPVSVPELWALLMESQDYRVLKEARDELRRRFFDEKSEYIQRVAMEAEQA
jgi:hypothetical protein